MAFCFVLPSSFPTPTIQRLEIFAMVSSPTLSHYASLRSHCRSMAPRSKFDATREFLFRPMNMLPSVSQPYGCSTSSSLSLTPPPVAILSRLPRVPLESPSDVTVLFDLGRCLSSSKGTPTMAVFVVPPSSLVEPFPGHHAQLRGAWR